MGLVGLGLVHELNTPLAMAELSLELLIERFDGPHPPDATQASAELKALLQQVRRMSALVRRLRALATGQSSPRRSIALDSVLDAAFALARPTLAAIGDVKLSRGPRVDTHLETDPLLLEQAILMLILNAADAAAGSSDARVSLSAEIGAVVVRDNGPGFSDPQAVRTLGRSSKGTMGIGLNFAELIIAELGGQLRLSNHPQGGAVARIELGQSEYASPNQTSGAEKPTVSGASRSSGTASDPILNANVTPNSSCSCASRAHAMPHSACACHP
jgi:two-component system C4-dicarboxylate transport sensor histidine kinase DctB